MSNLHSEAAVWAEDTQYSADELVRAYRDYVVLEEEAERKPLDFQRWAEHEIKIKP